MASSTTTRPVRFPAVDDQLGLPSGMTPDLLVAAISIAASATSLSPEVAAALAEVTVSAIRANDNTVQSSSP